MKTFNYQLNNITWIGILFVLLSVSCKKDNKQPEEPQPQPIVQQEIKGPQSGEWIWCGGDTSVTNLILTATCLVCYDSNIGKTMDRYKLSQNIGYLPNNEIDFITNTAYASSDTIQFAKSPHWYKFYRKK